MQDRVVGKLVLEDGAVFSGYSFGHEEKITGEVVFNTAMMGYQEILTDPSYHFQLVTMTYPQIGNYGVNPKDFESRRIYAGGFIIREYSPVVSHWQATRSLDEYLKHYGVVGISDIDTRQLTRHLRDQGAQMGMITTSDEPFDVQVRVHAHHGMLLVTGVAIPESPGRPGPRDGFHDPDVLDRAAGNARQTGVDVMHQDDGRRRRRLGSEGADRRDDRRAQARTERHGIETARRLGVKQDFVPKHVEQIDSHLLALTRHAGGKEVFRVEWERILIFQFDAFEGVEELPA